MLTKSEIFKIIAEVTGVSHKVVANVFTTYTDLLKSELKKEGSIKLPDIGKFKVTMSSERIAKNPMTGAQIKIPPKARLKFSPIKDIKESVLLKAKWEYEDSKK
ncbi:HU family DNA-binding protein [Mycoplasmoides pirum]|uniref:HU family DNA-binding protein n=1 Tax=Mycoplasmoides pirum TaxID=2122 RepID=UPI000482C210|nr:HU family DNA-binding protein [Mycoplasmoides pirum]